MFTAAPHSFLIGEQEVSGFAYNGQVPGPTIYAKRGDRITVELKNELETATTLHWHGLHVPIEMDGVTWQRDPILPGESFTYSFVLDQVGTYWYHPHFDTERMMDLGLYGAIVIEEPSDPPVTEDLILVFDSWAENESKVDIMHHGSIDGKIRHWTINGLDSPTLQVSGGDIIRARILNVSNGGFLHLQWPEMEIIATDQGLLPALETPESVVLAPGDRIEAIWRIGDTGFELSALPYSVFGGVAFGDNQTLMTVEVSEPQSQPTLPGFSFSELEPTPDPGFTHVTYVLHGNAVLGNWLINSETFPEVTIHQVASDQAAIIEVRNLSGAEHPFHLHGYGFEVLSRNGVPPAMKTVEDTINLKIYDTVRLRIDGTNPGDWMAHCHILSHQEEGMMTVLRVGSE